jgi:hypothetical protein
MAKSAGTKFASSHYPKATREAAKTFASARRARKVLGTKAAGKPETSKVKKEYRAADKQYQKAGRALAQLTGYAWK